MWRGHVSALSPAAVLSVGSEAEGTEDVMSSLPTPPCCAPLKKGYSPLGCELHRCTWPMLNPKSLFVQHHRRCWDSPAFIWGFSF